MSKSKIAQQARAQSATVQAFNIAAWSESLRVAAINLESGAKHLLELALEARGKVEADTAREKFQDAFAAAIVATHGVTDEEARKSKSYSNRVSDAMAVFKAEALPTALPGNLQRAADAVRKAKREAGGKLTRAPRAGGKLPTVDAADVNPLALLEAALNALADQCGENDTALSLVGELKDLAMDLAACLAVQGDDVPAEQADAA